jgi:hypothetical protein
MGDEFDFLEEDLKIDESDLDNLDKQFIESIKSKTAEWQATDNNNSWTFALCVVILILFVVCICLAIYWVSKGKIKRQEYADIGYRKK